MRTLAMRLRASRSQPRVRRGTRIHRARAQGTRSRRNLRVGNFVSRLKPVEFGALASSTTPLGPTAVRYGSSSQIFLRHGPLCENRGCCGPVPHPIKPKTRIAGGLGSTPPPTALGATFGGNFRFAVIREQQLIIQYSGRIKEAVCGS